MITNPSIGTDNHNVLLKVGRSARNLKATEPYSRHARLVAGAFDSGKPVESEWCRCGRAPENQRNKRSLNFQTAVRPFVGFNAFSIAWPRSPKIRLPWEIVGLTKVSGKCARSVAVNRKRWNFTRCPLLRPSRAHYRFLRRNKGFHVLTWHCPSFRSLFPFSPNHSFILEKAPAATSRSYQTLW